MLRNRSRAVTTKQALMPDQSFPSPPSQNHTKPISSFFGSPNYLTGFLLKGHFDIDHTMSPTSVLDAKPFMTTTTTNQPFGYDKNHSKPKTPTMFSGNKHPWEELDPKGVGLALVDSMIVEKIDEISSHSRKVLFGSKLKIQIPSIPPNAFSTNESLKSPADFGIKTRNSVVVNSLSPFGSVKSSTQTKEYPGFLSASEMELSEDYTCVISHGPNPKTTIIYDDCIVERGCGGVPLRTSDKIGTIRSGCGGVGFFGMKKEYNSISERSNFPPESFLSSCYTCKKNLEQGKDIYIYRGEKAFCSSECRCQEMLFDEVKNPGI
ncbi:FCS-Like Zinc finger 8-like [Rhododendron vialii]|uniref:FCS-Like Zinc finger 8-like n=1 Tax=Rhododendron vialii TaxID=182163 RepID=UPI00265F20BC|nr:FCS-Like Zinc finger 8-like [Rhododendron vialii]